MIHVATVPLNIPQILEMLKAHLCKADQIFFLLLFRPKIRPGCST